MKDPAFLFYSSDFLSGTMLMSDEDVGKYIRLLCLQHQKGHLKEKEMLNICKEFNEDIFSKFKKDEEGKYFNERLEEESNKRKAYSESRRNNRKKVDNTNTCIYLIKDMLTGLTKIGSSNKPERRLVELKNQYQNENLMLIAYVENVEQKLETELHNMYKEKNQVNEWFKLSEDDISKIIKNNHMKPHMNNHMYKHMENENTNINENININKNNKVNDSCINDLQNIIDFYNDNIGLITPYGIEILSSYAEEMSNELIMLAMKKSVEANKRTIQYIKAILNNWQKAGIKTVLQAEQEDEQFRKKSELGTSEREKELEEWLNECK